MESVPPTPALPPQSPKTAAAYEATHVQSVYDTIAPHFAATRYAPWPRVDAFLSSLPTHSLIADVGCGNGKYLVAASSCVNEPFAMGTDLCAGLAKIAAGRGREIGGRFDAGVADVLRLPFRDGMFDAAVCVAVVHHLSTVERRVAAWREVRRVLRVGGRMLAYVWALERPVVLTARKGRHGQKMLSRRFGSQDVFVPWHMRRRKAGAESDKILGGTEEVLRRFYHVYREGELEEELGKVEGVAVVESFYDHQNWCAVVERVD